MRQTVIVAATTALVTAIVASWGTTVIIGYTEHPEAATASTSIDVMKMMRDAKGLPEEKFDAH